MNEGGDRRRSSRGESRERLQAVRDKFTHFHALLDRNRQVLEIIADMEEKTQGEYLFDLNYIRLQLVVLRAGVTDIIERMIALGDRDYEPLRGRFALIDGELNVVLPGDRPIREDSFTRPFDGLSRMHSFSVGSKNAQLGEMKSRLGLPVPEGFAITAWAYKHFIDANDLQKRISKRIDSVDIRSYRDLVRISSEIQEMVSNGCVPDDLAQAIEKSYAELAERSATRRFSLRSSAIGEDTLHTFAGQYASYLNVRSERLIDRYREVVASKFTPQAIYYFLSHSLSESELAMSVGCVAMVDALASGVAYTRCPVNPADDAVQVHSIYGLGTYLVNGRLAPDVFRVSRSDLTILERSVSDKPVRMVMRPSGGTVEEKVNQEERRQPSINEEQIRQVAAYAIQLEEHYGCPQDIEWAIDREGHLFLLQTRPLQVVAPRRDVSLPDFSELDVVIRGGTTVCHGAGSGHIYHVSSVDDLAKVPEGVVLVSPSPFPGLVMVMGKVNALITQVGSVASHMATIAREYRIPTLVGVEQATKLPAGRMVTVDATDAVVYAGEQSALIEARRPEYHLVEEESIFDILGRVLDLISPLRLVRPEDDDFIIENCVTFHDIVRFAHQMAMEEMFYRASGIEDKERIGLLLDCDMPLKVIIIYLDREHDLSREGRSIREDEIGSVPMEAFWAGVAMERLPKTGSSANVRGMPMWTGSTPSGDTRRDYSETSFAVLSNEYMILSLRMGYHFSTLETMVTADLSKNYIQMQFHHGGARMERRERRIKLMTHILRMMDFEVRSRQDFLEATISYKDHDEICRNLTLLGRLTIKTKQLDMALSSDAVTDWYTKDFMKQLGLEPGESESA